MTCLTQFTIRWLIPLDLPEILEIERLTYSTPWDEGDFREALYGKYRILHYSGDTDGAVPTLGTQAWIASTPWVSSEDWRAYLVDNQVAGYVEAYEGDFTFATVHGSGHMVPQDKRPQAFHLISSWLSQSTI